jgi:hypothetical protein
MTESWRRKWRKEERIWPARARRIGHEKRPRLWYALAREAITYPETMLLARILNDPRWGWRRGSLHTPYAEIARQLQRPWLEDPAHYPHNFSQWIRAVPRRLSSPGRHTTVGGYRWAPHDNETIELTRLGYIPSTPPRKKNPQRPGMPATSAHSVRAAAQR